MNDLYDAPETEADAPQGDEQAPPEEQQEQGQPVLVNKELCADCKPGDKLIIQVVKDHGDELEVQYVGKQEEEEGMPPEEGMEAPGPESGAGGGMMD